MVGPVGRTTTKEKNIKRKEKKKYLENPRHKNGVENGQNSICRCQPADKVLYIGMFATRMLPLARPRAQLPQHLKLSGCSGTLKATTTVTGGCPSPRRRLNRHSLNPLTPDQGLSPKSCQGQTVLRLSLSELSVANCLWISLPR